MKTRVLMWLTLGVVSLPLPMLAQPVIEPEECRNREPVVAQPPAFPPELAAGGVQGKVMLLVSYDVCGQVTETQVEKSSGEPALDAAASEAARTWRFSPQERDGKWLAGKVRVPIDFSLDATFSPSSDLGSRSPGKERALEQWRRMQVPEVRADADATVPAYLPDTQAIPVASIDDAIALLESKAELMTGPTGVKVYRLNDGLDITSWELFDHGWAFARSVIRRRLVSDGKKAFWVTSGLCGAADRATCEQFEQMMREEGRQKTIPPPPSPPPSAMR